MWGILIPNRTKVVNFSNSFNGRAWLEQLKGDRRYGLLFRPNVRLPRNQLGFSFSTNEFGLRGPASPQAGGVILGTSFAMGLSVDDGDNWWDLVLNPVDWFNASMPVGPRNHLAVLDDFYHGPYNTLLYLYHPNVWKTAVGYEAARNADRDIFEQMGWSASMRDAVKGYPNWVAREAVKMWLGYSLYRSCQGTTFHFNAVYSLLDVGKNAGFINEQMALLNTIFSRFRKVIAVRVPIKEEVPHLAGGSVCLDHLRTNYEELWAFFQRSAVSNVMTHVVSPHGFHAEDFLPYDTHWSAAGNRRFVSHLRPLLRRHGVAGVLDPV